MILGVVQIVFYIGCILFFTKPLGAYMQRVYEGNAGFMEKLIGPLERFLYKASGIDPDEGMSWKEYAFNLLLFNFFGFLLLYGLLRLQGILPLNPEGFGPLAPHTAFNAAASFTSNTNWQSYSGEASASYLTQMMGFSVQNFLSASTGMTVLVAFIRGFTRKTSGETIGNFWKDLVRGVLYILLPLSLVLATALISQGVVQTLSPYKAVRVLQPFQRTDRTLQSEQVLPLGPAASQIAIKQLGTNGGGFFNANSAHPFENPTPLSNFLEMLAILLIPAALCYTFGAMVRDKRQGWALFSTMMILFLAFLVPTFLAEQNPVFCYPDTLYVAGDQSWGNMEGKEVRFGVSASSLWAVATTSASNGSVNAMHDSLTPLGGLFPVLLMQIGEVVFGGVGSGLYGMIVFALMAVFMAGLMVGRTPEYLGKKVEPYEMKFVSLAILVPVLCVLFGTALAVSVPSVRASLGNSGPHGFSELLYAFSSASNNNGSAFAGLGADTPFLNTALGIAMLFGRYWVILCVLAIAGSLAKKKYVPPSQGSLPTHTPLFVFLLVFVVLLIAALSFFPALALGPIVEHFEVLL